MRGQAVTGQSAGDADGAPRNREELVVYVQLSFISGLFRLGWQVILVRTARQRGAAYNGANG